jgi:crotonobetainyl-CoA:carnitine CoA-transferase CaiB-like acyl-CoA transferase
MSTTTIQELPLHGVRVVDAVDGPLQSVGRILADLGADVLRLEPPGGSTARGDGVLHGDQSLTFAIRNANKASVAADTATDHGTRRVRDLLASADILLVDGDEDEQRARGLDRATARSVNPRLVVASLTDFGLHGPRADWLGTPDVHFALSTVLSRSGLPEVTEPLLPPSFLAYEAAAAQGAWAVILGYVHALGQGAGESIDFSVNDALVQILDPALGIGGSARAGESLMDLAPGRPDARHLYPIFPVRDGWVRICVLSARQWQGMFHWLGEPEEFADPKYNSTPVRFGAARTLYPLIGAMLATLTREEATEQGQSFGVPTAGLAHADEVLRTEAFLEAGAFTSLEVGDATATVPTGMFELDGVRSGIRSTIGAVADAAAPLPAPLDGPRPTWAPTGPLPFSGLRVLDLGVIVVGAELGRLFGDYGAEVIKLESREFPDGSRGSLDGSEIADGFAAGQRNKRSLGLNLKSDAGKAIFRQLVADSDVVLTNFKPGTLAGLGFDWETLQAINPRIVLSESSAFGNSGPWSTRLGYGPLVRASAGMSLLWSYPEIDGSFSDAITIYPDHVVGRLNAIAVTALLLRRSITGRGGRVSTAQVDAIFAAMADRLALESVRPGSVTIEGSIRGVDAPRGLFPAAGDDEWVVVDPVGDDRFRALATTIGRAEWLVDPRFATAEGRLASAAELRAVLVEWTSARPATAAADALQAAGVPAGQMLRPRDFAGDAHFAARGVFGRLVHPQRPAPLMTNLAEARFERVPQPRLEPAPRQAEHTREIARELLGYDDGYIDELLEDGVLQVHPAALPAPAPAPLQNA